MTLNDIYVRCFNLDVNIDVYIFDSFEGFRHSKEREAIYKFDMLEREDLGDTVVAAFKLAGFKPSSNSKRTFTKLYVYLLEEDASKFTNSAGKV